MLPGVYKANKKNGEEYFRASITFRSKHISLGSYASEEAASNAYNNASNILSSSLDIVDYKSDYYLPFDKWVSLINFRDNNVYFCNPIYLKSKFFYYYLSQNEVMTFDIEDLFYYASHKIQKRNGRLFVADYGMQVTLGTRYGIRPYAVAGRDYSFLNGDCLDYRYSNIKIFSHYYGVIPSFSKNKGACFKVYIHINGNFLVGTYDDESTAAIAYNKAVDYLKKSGINKNYGQNFIEELSAKNYAEIYSSIKINSFVKKLIKKGITVSP